MELSNILIEKFKQKSLSHFYIISPGGQKNKSDLSNFASSWTKELLASFLIIEKKIDKEKAESLLEMGHEDILWIKSIDEKNYSIDKDDLGAFFRFQQYLPRDLSQRFVVIEDAHFITERYANKLLKTLEEPQDKTTILLLNPLGVQLLPTITSRAISLRPVLEMGQFKPNRQMKTEELVDEFSGIWSKSILEKFKTYLDDPTKTSQFTESIKNNSSHQRKLLEVLIDYSLSQDFPAAQVEKVLEEIKWFKKSETFHNSALERVHGLLFENIGQNNMPPNA